MCKITFGVDATNGLVRRCQINSICQQQLYSMNRIARYFIVSVIYKRSNHLERNGLRISRQQPEGGNLNSIVCRPDHNRACLAGSQEKTTNE